MVQLKDIKKISEFEDEYLNFIELHHPEVLNTLKEGVLNDEILAIMEKAAKDLSVKYQTK